MLFHFCLSTPRFSWMMKALFPLLGILVLLFNMYSIPHMTVPVLLENHVTLTLMTTFSDSLQREVIESNTVKNWALLGNNVHTLNWYVNKSFIQNFSSSYGWLNRPTTHSNNNLPEIKYLYLEAANITNTEFYGFSNSDILFSNDVIRTLRAVKEYHSKNHQGIPLLMVGKRMDVPVTKIGNITEPSHEELLKKYKTFGKLRGSATIDYFITGHPSEYPWEGFLDVVVARNGWDNYMISYAHDNDVITYDSSLTTTAIHQSYTGKGSSGVSSRLRYLNYEILKTKNKHMIGHILGNGQLKNTHYFSNFSSESESIIISTRRQVKMKNTEKEKKNTI